MATVGRAGYAARMPTKGIFDTETLVTSEAVEIDLPAAPLPSRMASGLIDLLVIVVLFLLGSWLSSGVVLGSDVAFAQAVVILVTVTVLVAVPVAQETLLHGRTLGKLALGLRTVRDDAGPIGFRHALTRALLAVPEVWLTAGGVAVLVAATNEKAKRLGDLAAGTYVVRERVRLRLPPAPQMPPPLAAWATGADLGVLPDALAIGVRQYLARGESLTPSARVGLGQQLYAQVLQYVSPPPPPEAPGPAVLAAVMAERRRRDLLRLERDDRLRSRVLGPDPLLPRRPAPRRPG